MKEIKVLFVGSNPSNYSLTSTAFHYKTKSGKTLQKWMDFVVGSSDKISYEYCSTNVSNMKTPNNAPLTSAQIKSEAENKLLPEIVGLYFGYKIVALGKTAEKALTLLDIKHFAMPHPSGRNRLLNDKQYMEEKLKSLREYLRPKSKTKKS